MIHKHRQAGFGPRASLLIPELCHLILIRTLYVGGIIIIIIPILQMRKLDSRKVY